MVRSSLVVSYPLTYLRIVLSQSRHGLSSNHTLRLLFPHLRSRNCALLLRSKNCGETIRMNISEAPLVRVSAIHIALFANQK